jgi:hypothetical protein
VKWLKASANTSTRPAISRGFRKAITSSASAFSPLLAAAASAHPTER